MVDIGPITFQAQKLIVETHVANTRFTVLLVPVSGMVAVFTVSDNHPTANSVQLSRKLLRQQRSRLHTGLLRVRHCSAVGDAGSMVTNSARPLMVRTDIRTG
jgi:hypothetical protein